MTDWLLDTLVWTAALIALVLLIRRPVAQWFGAKAAYALWALPMLRLVMPPIHLPAWMSPSDPLGHASNPVTYLIHDPVTPVATQEAVSGSMEAASDASTPISPMLSLELVPWLEISVAVWLIGAAIIIGMRFSSYFRLRGLLLEGAREVGRSGAVRIVETPGTRAPLAFGVVDKVVALPPDFMAQPDRIVRDLALDHELAHHRGYDLLINMIAQPLFALHWWNPLGRYGWLALRRDQEAACDARVVAAKPAEERAAYANLIAGFATGPNLALAAPMACPVLGEKSIVHRLRSLTMTDHSPRRQIAGRAILGVGLMALPLTASMTFAKDAVPSVPDAPLVAHAGGDVPVVPAVPQAPTPPVIQAIESIDPDLDEEMKAQTTKVIIIRDDEAAEAVNEGSEGAKTLTRTHTVKVVNRGQRINEQELEELIRQAKQTLEDAEPAIKNAMIVEEARVQIELSPGEDQTTIVKVDCNQRDAEGLTIIEREELVKEIHVCEAKIFAHALSGLEQARVRIENNSKIPKRTRKRILRSLDEQIERWSELES
ncbi:MAG: M56 family metallopeptidase [Erythrobacter sp.]